MAERGRWDRAVEIANIPEKVGMGIGLFGVALAFVFPPALFPVALGVASGELFMVSAASHEITGSFHSGSSE